VSPSLERSLEAPPPLPNAIAETDASGHSQNRVDCSVKTEYEKQHDIKSFSIFIALAWRKARDIASRCR